MTCPVDASLRKLVQYLGSGVSFPDRISSSHHWGRQIYHRFLVNVFSDVEQVLRKVQDGYDYRPPGE
jgi:hypothetical protein